MKFSEAYGQYAPVPLKTAAEVQGLLEKNQNQPH
jgi:hypothetical protein